LKKGSPEMKAHMAKLRAMRKGNKGEGILDDIKAGAERAGQFVKEGAKKAIDLVGGEEAAKALGVKAGKAVLDPLANVIGSAVEKKFGKTAGEAVKLAMKKAGSYGLDKLDEYDLSEESAEAIKKEAKDLVVDEVVEGEGGTLLGSVAEAVHEVTTPEGLHALVGTNAVEAVAHTLVWLDLSADDVGVGVHGLEEELDALDGGHDGLGDGANATADEEIGGELGHGGLGFLLVGGHGLGHLK
jgi:hypothetical protein